MIMLLLNIVQQSLETEFWIAICHSKIVRNRVLDCHLLPDWDKLQSKTLFLAIFYQRSSIVKRVFDCHLSSVKM